MARVKLKVNTCPYEATEIKNIAAIGLVHLPTYTE
jgi:hypothetical protein